MRAVQKLGRIRLMSVKVAAIAVTAVLLGALLSERASASVFEQVGIFSGSLELPKEFPEEVQLGGVGGMAVNVKGVGVPAGTVYAATFLEGQARVARFTPNGESLKFSEAWQVAPKEEPYERCGPDGEPAHPNCAARVEASAGSMDVEVDQTTGNVYVFNTQNLPPGSLGVTVFTADGSKVISRFGPFALSGETTAASPEKIHGSPAPGGMAVDGTGTVYIFDLNASDNFYHRLMVFKPQTPGDYEHYVYAGQGSDVGAGFLNETEFPAAPTTDSAGNVYVAGDGYIERYDPSQPSKSICGFTFKSGGITAATVNPETGEPFFYSYKDKKIHQLSACKEGKFSETHLLTLAPKRGDLFAMAFDPERQFAPSRPAGVLYGATPEAVPGTGGKGEPGQSALGYIFAPAKESPPLVDSESVAGVGASSAELRAAINPKGFETRYAFQYMTEAAYEEAGKSFAGASEAPVGGAILGSGQGDISAAVSISGLLPDTEYRYRAIATSHCALSEPGKVCEASGAAQTFRTFPVESQILPDSRAYELVSPPQKNGGQVLPADPAISSCPIVECKPGAAFQHFPMQSAPDGERVVFEGNPFSPSEGAVIENEYLARRGASGWTSTNLTPSLLRSKAGLGYKIFDADLGEGLLEQVSPSLSPEAPGEYTNLYRQPTASPLSLSPLLTETPPNRQPGNGSGRLELSFAGASEDLSRFFFGANDELNGEGSGGAEAETNLYEWFAGQLHLVNLGPGEEVLPGAVFGSGGLLGAAAADVSNAVSSNGSHAFWSSTTGQLYVRLGGTKTVEIPDHTGKFLTAAADGSRVLLSDGRLYGELEAEPPIEVADLTQGKGGFQGIAGQSEDLARIYFVDSAVLSGKEENSAGAKAQPGQSNLYAWEEGATAYVATLLAGDNVSPGDWQPSPAVRTAEASPDGRWVTFLSKASLTHYDNTAPATGSCRINALSPPEGPCDEVFLYDSVTGELTCPSCNPSGARPLGDSALRVIFTAQGSLPQPRYLTNTGRLFFDSRDSLVPVDTNGGVEDVYEFEPQGIGGCKREGGCVALISAGSESVDSNFLAMDESGDNAFFTSRDRLVPADTDELIDLYDARVGGGFESKPPPPDCQGEACQPSGTPPAELSPGAPSTGGNPKPPPPRQCRRNQVKRGNRCVKKPHHKRHHARRANRKLGGAK